ncbi:sushi domain-containing protein 5 [Melanotaenia boesemani]|uniref:sushi domain-containing protein 5 n=1 Tax=Melanotaenia boesemani TaxID=1250792 RepID=UPI001C0531A9|nr:sushi domain-containing protein 5 [Melanotaenia boesemani]
MIDQSNLNVQSLLFGCLACLVVTSVVNADGRVFVLDLRNSSGVQGFRDAEQACASKQARLASVEELRHAVMECFFSQCTRGWLYGGTVGTTVCNVVGSLLKAVVVRTENATEDMTHLDAFCIKDKGLPCGDPPSFPNAILQEHSGFEMGDELVYTCVSGYVMPSGNTAFSLLCDSCGEWYGTVQICVKDELESHVDYEDKFTDSYEEADRDHESLEEAQDEMSEEAYDGKRSMEQQEKIFNVKVQQRHHEPHGGHDVEGKVTENIRALEGTVEGATNQESAFEDFTSRPRWEEERIGLVTVDVAAATEEPVSVLSQKHMFWFPPEAFPEEEPPVFTDSVTQNPATQITQRASGGQSEESKEHESQEKRRHPIPIDVDDHDDEPEANDNHEHDNDDRDEDNSRHDDLDIHNDDHYDDQDDVDSHSQEEDHDDHVKRPAQHGDLDRQDRYKDHDDHYDMGENEEDRDRIRYGSQEYDDRDDAHDEHQSYEDHDNPIDDHSDDDGEHPDGSEEHQNHDDHDSDDDKDHDIDHDDHDDHDDHEHKDDELYDNHDSHEDDDHLYAIISGATEGHQNITQRVPGGKGTKDESWLDGYPVILEQTENGKATTGQTGPVDGKSVVKTTDRPNEVEIRRPVPYTSSPDTHESPTKAPKLDHKMVEEVKPSFTGSPAASPDHLQPSDTPSYSDTLDYDTQQAAPTHSWLDDLTEHPFLDHGPAPPVQDDDIFNGVIGEHTVHNLPGETGERGEAEGEMRETICVGEDCPPHPPNPSSQGPKVAAIIVALCAVATAVIIGVWCYRRQQQKSSMYEMNGKGQSQTRQGQQIEMQQKV